MVWEKLQKMNKQEIYNILKFKRFTDGISTLTEYGFRIVKIGDNKAILRKDDVDYHFDFCIGLKGRPYWNIRL